ncbi:MAG: hypothetical protein WAJ91_06305 [Rhodoplanes sp.]
MPQQSHIKDRIAAGEAAAYIAEMSADLAKIARQHVFDALGFILDMARLEAENLSERDRPAD